MSVSDVEWDVASLVRDLIDENWSDDVREPDYIELVTEDEQGNARKRVRRTNEYIHVAEEQERGLEYSDIFRDARNLSASCYVELSTPESRQRREELFAEVERIGVEHRKRPDTPGGWDDITMNAQVIDDENFGWWMASITFNFTKRKDLIE
jgi:hypothetical protein